MLTISELVDFSRKNLSENKNDAFRDVLPDSEKELLESLVLSTAEELNETSFHLQADQKAALYRLQEKLKRHILQYIPANHNNNALRRAYYNCVINYAVVKFLFGKSYKKAAADVAEKTFKLAMKYGFPDIALEMSRRLFTFYGVHSSKKKKAEFYYNQVEPLLYQIKMEVSATWNQTKLASQFTTKKALPDTFVNEAKTAFYQLKPYLSEIKTIRYRRQTYLVGIYYLLAKKDFSACQTLCKEAITLMQSDEAIYDSYGINLMRNYLALSSLINQDYQTCESVLEEVCLTTAKYKQQWFSAKLFIFVLRIRQKDFNESWKIFNEVNDGQALKRESVLLQNRWKLFEAYLHLCDKLRHKKKTDAKYKVYKYLNDTSVFTTDKKAMNVSLIICYYLHLLVDKKLDKLIDMEDSVQSYIGRHLVKNASFRNKCFLKLLMIIPKHNFHPEAIARHAEKWRKKLLEVPLKYDGTSNLIEIVPFEQLWDMIMQYLWSEFKMSYPNHEAIHPYLIEITNPSRQLLTDNSPMKGHTTISTPQTPYIQAN